MVVFGGLEFVAGGYLLHRYHKNKNEKKRLQAEAQQRRHHTFPNDKPQTNYPYQQQSYHQSQPGPIPPQKYTCYASTPIPPPGSQSQYFVQHRPQALPHTQSFEIPRRPVPKPQSQPQPYQQPQQQAPPLLIQPLQRADSMATISRMPIANGYRPNDVAEPPTLPPRHYQTNLSPIPQSPYSSAAFSHSSPALGPAPLTPTTPVYASPQFGRQTIDDNWETYTPQHGQQHAHGHYAPSESTALGESDPNDPPPPYMP